MAALERHLPGEDRAERPDGGHHVWVTLDARSTSARCTARRCAPA